LKAYISYTFNILFLSDTFFLCTRSLTPSLLSVSACLSVTHKHTIPDTATRFFSSAAGVEELLFLCGTIESPYFTTASCSSCAPTNTHKCVGIRTNAHARPSRHKGTWHMCGTCVRPLCLLGRTWHMCTAHTNVRIAQSVSNGY